MTSLDKAGPITRQFTASEIEELLITAAEAVCANAPASGTLSQRQAALAKRVFRALHGEAASPGPQRASWPADARVVTPASLRRGIDGIVQTIHRRGFLDDVIAEEIYALAVRLLHPARIIDPDTAQPLRRRRSDQLCYDLGMLPDDVDATSAPRTWVIAQLGAVCARITQAWTDRLQGAAQDLAQTGKTPTRRNRIAQAQLDDVKTSWPAALEDVQAMLTIAAETHQ